MILFCRGRPPIATRRSKTSKRTHIHEVCKTMTRLAFIALGLAVLSWTNSSPSSAADPVTTWRFADIEGKLHKPFDDKSTRGIALVFTSTDCPIANSYQPLLQRLAEKHAENGVRLFMIHPSPELTVDQACKHAKDFKIKAPVVIDTDLSISRRVGARVTPEVFVFVRGQKEPVYQGRIDNRYAGYGRKRNVATTNELADALDAVVAGRPIKNPKTKAVGCFISYAK